MLCLLAVLLCASSGRAYPEQKPPEAEVLFLQARQHFEKQEWEMAGIAAGKALQANPRLADAELMLGLIATVEAKFGIAEKHFLRALSIQPQNDQARGYLASTYLQQKRYSEAVVAFQRVLRQNPKNQAANYNLGLIALIQEKPARARVYFEQVLRENPEDVPALTGSLECRLLLKQFPESRQLAAKLESRLPPKDPRLFQVATLLALHRQYDPAIAILENVRKEYPQSYDVNYNLALGYLGSGQYERATQILEPLLGQPKSAEAHSLLAQAREKLQLPDQALHAYQRAAELEPGNEGYRFDYAYALLQYVSTDAAMAAFSSGARDFPKSWQLRTGLGSAYYLAGRNAEAVQAFLKAVQLEPAAKLPYYLLGIVYEFAGDGQPAIRDVFRAYLGKEPRDPWAYYHYSNILYSQAQVESPDGFEAVKSYLKTALAMNPDFAEAHLQMGIIEQAQGQLAKSIQSLEKAVRINPSLLAAHYRLALVYQRMGNKEKSKAEFELYENLKAASATAQEKKTLVQLLIGQRR